MTLPDNIQTLIDDFAFLSDWEERYMYVIELGKTLAILAPQEKTDATKVKGCVSQVWLVTELDQSKPPRFHFRGDSDAHIVKGLVAIVLEIFSNRTATEILSLDPANILDQLDLTEHLSPQRSNGLKAMIARIQSLATAQIATP